MSKSEVTTRLAAEADIADLSVIDGNAEWKPWIHPQAVKEGRVLLGLVGGKPAGYLRHGSFLWDDRAPFIQAVNVGEDFRRQRVATSLIERFLTDCEVQAPSHLYAGVYSSVDETNAPSIALHEGLGFEQVGTLNIPDQDELEIVYFKPIVFE